MSSAINYLWNILNEKQKVVSAYVEPKFWLSGFDFCKLTTGMSKELKISSSTIQDICNEYNQKRIQHKKPYLKWRSRKTHLPYIPWKANAITIDREAALAKYYGLEFSYWKSREILGQIKCGSICADSMGHWYINITCEVSDLSEAEAVTRRTEVALRPEIGIDLGLKDVVTTSEGLSVKAPGYYRRLEKKIATAQRAKHKKQVKALHAKVKNQRKDFNHKLSKNLVNSSSKIFVGDVSPTEIIEKTKPGMAKSVYDAGWYQLKSFIKYKALAGGVFYSEIEEAYSTQVCSECGSISKNSPRGIKGLSIREWVCSHCSSHHLRDVNAAKNILRFGHESLLKLDMRAKPAKKILARAKSTKQISAILSSTGIPGL